MLTLKSLINPLALLLILTSHDISARIVIPDDKDLTGCSVALEQYIFNFQALTRPNK